MLQHPLGPPHALGFDRGGPVPSGLHDVLGLHRRRPGHVGKGAGLLVEVCSGIFDDLVGLGPGLDAYLLGLVPELLRYLLGLDQRLLRKPVQRGRVRLLPHLFRFPQPRKQLLDEPGNLLLVESVFYEPKLPVSQLSYLFVVCHLSTPANTERAVRNRPLAALVVDDLRPYLTR